MPKKNAIFIKTQNSIAFSHQNPFDLLDWNSWNLVCWNYEKNWLHQLTEECSPGLAFHEKSEH